MLIRIVKMTFNENKITQFLKVFEESKPKIRAFEGCKNLELWRDKNATNVYFTYSWWQDETYLQRYRTSELFAITWAKTKVLFAAKPEAWSVEQL